MPSPETATMTASCVISYIGIGEVWQVPMESRPWRRLSSVPRTQVSRSLLHGPPQAEPLGSPSSSISLLQMPHFMPHLPPWESRVNQDRSGLTLLQQNSGFAQIYLFSSVENKTETQNVGSLLWTPAGPTLQCRAYPSTTHKEKLSRDGGGTGAPAKLCELTLSSQACISCRDTKSSCGRKRERITAVLICLP